MKRNLNPHRPVALAALIAATALPFTFASAQEAVPAPAAPPPVESAVPAPEAPVVAPAAPAASERVFAPRQEVAQPVPPRPVVAAPEPEAPVAATPRPAAKRAVQRAERPVSRVVPAAPRATPAPVAVAPVKPPVAEVAPVPVPEPVAAVPEAAPPMTTPVQTVETRSTTPWAWIAGGVALLAALLGLLFVRRRRNADAGYGAPTYVAVDEAGAPVPEVDLAERPWIRLMLQPMGSETHGNQQTVDYDLIVENEGKVAARDVRVSSFLTGIKGSSMTATLGNGQAQTHHIDVAPGQSITLPASVTVRDGTDPKIVADARYALPDGSEGHLAARFGIDMSADEPAAEVEDVLERV